MDRKVIVMRKIGIILWSTLNNSVEVSFCYINIVFSFVL